MVNDADQHARAVNAQADEAALYGVVVEPSEELTVFKRVPTVEVAEAQTLLSDGALLLDVRRDDEWRAGRAPNAVHIPLDQLQDRVGEVPADRRVVAVCRSGSRSAQATRYLRQLGHDAINLDGGMQAWQRAGAEVVDDDGGAGRVA